METSRVKITVSDLVAGPGKVQGKVLLNDLDISDRVERVAILLDATGRTLSRVILFVTLDDAEFRGELPVEVIRSKDAEPGHWEKGAWMGR
jgi:hypothetical protein